MAKEFSAEGPNRLFVNGGGKRTLKAAGRRARGPRGEGGFDWLLEGSCPRGPFGIGEEDYIWILLTICFFLRFLLQRMVVGVLRY